MFAQPTWIQDIPEILQTLKAVEADYLDRWTIERLFRLRKTAAFKLLKRLGAKRSGNSLLIPRTVLAKRLAQLYRNPDVKFEIERRGIVAARIKAIRSERSRRSVVPVKDPLPLLPTIAGLPDTIELSRGRLTIRCKDVEDLLRQLVLVAQAVDTDYGSLKQRIE